MDRDRRRTRNILWELDQICQKQSVRRKAFSFQCKRRNRTAFSILWKINVHFENAPCKQRRPIQFEEKSYGKNCTGNHILWVELGIFKRESGRSWKLAWDSSRTVHFQLRSVQNRIKWFYSDWLEWLLEVQHWWYQRWLVFWSFDHLPTKCFIGVSYHSSY